MSKILLQTTITENLDDWDITRFSLLADELRAAGHEVTARNRLSTADDPMLSRLDELIMNSFGCWRSTPATVSPRSNPKPSCGSATTRIWAAA